MAWPATEVDRVFGDLAYATARHWGGTVNRRGGAPSTTYDQRVDPNYDQRVDPLFSPRHRPFVVATMRDILPPGPLRSKILLAIHEGPTHPTYREIGDVFEMSAVRVGQIIRKEQRRTETLP